ncbi:VWA domain-containing protein [Nannocystis punicea]|uniref:VWA domain-containing protein n=1 Tax=Nannocystis punicea TaxID=2995304 RepID=A0ABY7GVF0_9BACT|nr:VWA domain-containing protein [Nannocystis poenicansa]WAS90804.1 VWA domain-containing protein [Nannocystis poenicansa]
MQFALRWFVAAVLVAGLGAVSEAAAGDTLHGTRGARLREREHVIELRFAPGYATATVRRTVYNPAARADEVVYGLSLPDRAVATGLRLRERDGRSWLRGTALAVDEARGRHQRATGFDPQQRREPGDAALLAWVGPGSLSLQVFPVAAGRERTVETTLELPATWEDGRWVIAFDETGLDGAPAELIVHASGRADRLRVDGEFVRSGHRLALDGPHEVALVPAARPAVELELAAIAASSEQAFVHWRVTVAGPLLRIPHCVHVVVALDASRSLGAGVDEAQRRAARAYLEHLRAPGLAARVAVLRFDRRVRRWSDGWVSVERALELLAEATPSLANGSDVGLALREARALFAEAPADAPRRVLLLTDFMTASSRSPATHAVAAAETGAIVHLAAVADDEPALRRDDGHAWAAVAAGTGGVVWQAAAGEGEPESAAALFEEWARPVRIDALQIDLEDASVSVPASLAEGEGVEEQRLLARPVERIAVRGRTWNLPFVHEARRSGPLSRRWAALAFATDAVAGLDEAAAQRLARRGGAVTPWTSHVLAATTAGPSREGFVREPVRPDRRVGKGGGGGTGSGRGRRHGAGFRGRLDRPTWLEGQVAFRWLGCGGVGRGVEVELETTYDEVVDLEVRASAPAGAVACLREAIWALSLPTGDFVDPRARWTVAVPPAGPARR